MSEFNDNPDTQDRRTMALSIAGAATAAGAALAARIGGAAAAVDKPQYTFSCLCTKPTYRVNAKKGDPWYVITLRQEQDMRMRRHKEKCRDLTAPQLVDLMASLSRKGNLRNRPSLTIEGINWRLNRAHYDEATGVWTLHCKVCDTNPDARPPLAAGSEAGTESEDVKASRVYGCSCSGCDYCFSCPGYSKRFCNISSSGFICPKPPSN